MVNTYNRISFFLKSARRAFFMHSERGWGGGGSSTSLREGGSFGSFSFHHPLRKSTLVRFVARETFLLLSFHNPFCRFMTRDTLGQFSFHNPLLQNHVWFDLRPKTLLHRVPFIARFSKITFWSIREQRCFSKCILAYTAFQKSIAIAQAELSFNHW